MNQFCRVNWPKGIKTLKSKTIKLSQEVVNYLKEDAIFVNEKWKQGGIEDNGIHFLELEQLIKQIFDEYESVFIKLNWRAPLDCTNWLQDLKCHDMYDIMMALKCSGVIMEIFEYYDEIIDQNHPNKCQLITQSSTGYLLELKKYYELKPEREFRCFIIKQQLIAISQKNLYIITKDESVKEKLINYFLTIKDLIQIDQYVLDLYIDIPPRENIIVVDINPWNEHTRPKLFTYEELQQLQINNQCELRLVTNKNEIIQEDYSAYRESTNFEEFIQSQFQQQQ